MGNCLCRGDKKLKENSHIQEQNGDKHDPIDISDTVAVQVVGHKQPFSGIHDQELGDQHDPTNVSDTVEVQVGDQTQPSDGIRDQEEPLNPTREHAYHGNHTQDQIQPVKSSAVEQIDMTTLLQEAPDYYRPLSLKVSKALDNIGASAKSRSRWKNAAFTNEILLSVLSRYTRDDKQLYYQFGGSAEGTTTLGLWSDVDTLFCKENVEVVQDLTSGPLPEDKVCFLMISDGDTMPGYTKLQRLVSGVPQTVFNCSDVYVIDKVDRKGRFVVCRQRADNVHGPADMFHAEKRYPDQDIVYAYRCQTWPICASNWFDRPRYYHWPSAAMMDEMKTLGFFLVGVGHPNSREREKEWRISLSQQERMLMFSLNTTQYKCYVVLKMIKKDIIFPLIGRESVSSYHLKTCLFYVIENSPAEVWVPENLLTCVQACLMYLLKCCIDGKCPNYFIPEENMFEGRLDTSIRIKVQDIVQKLLSANLSFLVQIKCDYLGRQLRAECLLAPRFLEFAIFRGTIATRAYIGEIEIASFVSYSILSKCSKSNVDKCISSLLQTLCEINKIETVAEHNTFETKRVTAMLVSYLELSLISNIYVHQSMSRTTSGTVLGKPFSKKWDELSLKLDRLSPKLKQAMFLYSSGYYRSSLDILKGLEFLGESSWMTLCNCGNVHTEMTGDIAKAVDQRNMSMEEFQKTFLAFCVVFLPSERALIPTVLAYEMIRSVNMPVGSRDEKHDFWYDWAVLDGKFLLYFLLYLNHTKLSMRKNALADISKMNKVLIVDRNIGHRETALNVLGWVYEQQGRLDKAFACYRTSLQIKRVHNAAFWHLCVKFSDLINQARAARTFNI